MMWKQKMMNPVIFCTVVFLFCPAFSLFGTLQPYPASAADMLSAPRNQILVETAKKYDRPFTASPSYGKHVTGFKTADFVGPHFCFNCHHLLTDAVGNDVSIISDWRSTMMANAAKDPFWQAKVQSEVRRNPGLKKVIEQKCITCHMPMAWTQARAVEGYGEASMFGKGFLNKENSLHEAAMDGVSCTLCHQIMDEGLGTAETFSGNFKIDTSTEEPDRIIFGPYHDPVEKPMQTSVGYTPDFGAHTNHSVLCATCHTLFTPYVDGEGNVAGNFPEQTIFIEWRHSQYNVPEAARYDIGENPGPGRICQECHMPHTPPGKIMISNWAPDNAKPKEHFSKHFFVGGNVFMMDILEDNVDELNLTASSKHFEQTKRRTLEQLQNQSARLTLQDVRLKDSILTAGVTVENLVSHKFPSGFPSRRLWIHYNVADKNGEIIFESGKPLATGAISGNDNDENPERYEPHYTEITAPDQVQIYEAVMRDTDNRVTYTLLRASTYLKDSRLLPKGFDKHNVPPEIAVHGYAATDGDFQGGTDTITYAVNTGDHQGPFTVQVELLYSSLSYSFMEDLRRDKDLDMVARFVRMVDQADKMPIAVASTVATVR
ncbi:MAG: hypothetical protein M8357_09730 [Desulfobulbaceae bacterium]|nr:hypothetical protein [Desulfobulbaceae bacterium]